MLRRLLPRLSRFARICTLAIAICTSVISVSASPANATTSSAATPSVTTVSARMVLDCVHLTSKARAYAASHHYCGGATSKSHMSPYTIVSGACGSSRISIIHYPTVAQALILWGFDSTQGNVIFRNLTISWNNSTPGGARGSFGDTGPMLSTRWRNQRVVNSGAGTIFAALDGWILLWWGGTCAILHPVAHT